MDYLLSIVTICLLLFGLVYINRTHKAVTQKVESVAKIASETLAAERQVFASRVGDMETKLADLNKSVTGIWTLSQNELIAELTHLNKPIMDKLMTKIGPPSTMTDAEEQELTVALKQRMKDMGPEMTESEREAAEILPIIIKRAKREAVGGQVDKTELRLVMVKPKGESK